MRRLTLGYLLAAPLAVSTIVLVAACDNSSSCGASDVNSCGNIQISAQAKCEMELSGGCTVNCTPVHFEAQCYANCDGGCDISASATCKGSCQTDCSAQCQASPGSFDCQGSCEADCKGNCSGHCSGQNNTAECQASCEGSCTGDCQASCTGTPPSASCDAKCEASCQGECHAEANFDCQFSCQGDCYASLTGGCEADCQSPEGALYCDGQYVDTGNNLECCLSALSAYLEVDVTANGSAACSGGSCSAQGSASCSASIGPSPTREGLPYFLGGLALAGLGVARRRRS
jgi:MYXO-CTERM domain-containing protein